MLNKIFKSEDKRRVVNTNFDTIPTFAHIFNFESSKKFVKGKVVLDVGCWTGQLERLAYKSAKKLVAIDSNPEAIQFAKKELPDVNFVVARADKLPFKNSYFDTVFLMDVLEHVPEGSEKQILKEIRRVLKPKGDLIITTPNKHPMAILLDPAYFLLGHRHYSMKEVCSMLTDTNFKVQKMRVVGNAYSLMYANVSLLFKYTLGFEPKLLQQTTEFMFKEHGKEGFAFLYIRAKALK